MLCFFPLLQLQKIRMVVEINKGQSLVHLRKFDNVGKNILQIDFDYDFLLTAIVSHVKDYQLCWQFNKKLGFDFIRQEDLEINLSNKRKLSYFSMFNFQDELNQINLTLLSNKTAGDNLIQELVKVDYFLMIRDNYENLDQEELLKKIRSLPDVQTAFEVEVNELVSKQNLIF